MSDAAIALGADVMHEADKVRARIGLADAAARTARTYSGGMRRRPDLATVTFGALGTGVGLADDSRRASSSGSGRCPWPRSAVLGGRIVSDLVRNTFVVFLMCVVGYLVGFRVHTNAAAFLAGLVVLLLFACSLSVIFALVGLSVRTAESAQAGGFPMLAPLVFASTAFVPVAKMPGWLQVFARHQPLSVAVDAVRALSQGGPTTIFVPQSLAWTVGIIAIFGPLAVRKYRRTA